MKTEIVDIFDISYEGAGVGKIDGKVVFVPKSLKNERVKIEILKQNNKFMLGKVLDVLTANKNRRNPSCPYFEICGGCDFQHCDYGHEIDIKKEILLKELSKVGFEGNIEIVKSDKRLGYRNKIKLEVFDNKIGYFKAKSHDFFEINSCPVASNEINNSLPLIRAFLHENRFINLNNIYIKQIQNDVAICFLFSKNETFSHKNIKNLSILQQFSVFFAYGDILESDKTKINCVCGKSKLVKDEDLISFEYEVSAFNQINDSIAEKLYDFISQNSNNKRVVNAYSGQGYLTYQIARNAKFVYGIEYQRSAHKSAEKIKDMLPFYKIENICGKVEEQLKMVLLKDKIDLIVLDPAREGCQIDALNEILNGKIPEIFYISCNFSTLVRDLKVLLSKYYIKCIKIFDMFPCTANLETVALLAKNEVHEKLI